MEEIKRNPRVKKSYNVDFSVYFNPEDIENQDFMDCFGKHYDPLSIECSKCADREVCCILFKGVLEKKAKKIEEEIGSKFLDEADFTNLTTKKLLKRIESGKTTTKELIEIGMELSNCSDVIAVKEHLKAWIKANDFVSTKDGFVWIRE